LAPPWRRESRRESGSRAQPFDSNGSSPSL
jgi:hypothetical protein